MIEVSGRSSKLKMRRGCLTSGKVSVVGRSWYISEISESKTAILADKLRSVHIN